RSGDLQVRAVTVTDVLQPAGAATGPSAARTIAWSTTYSGIFAPESEDYRLEGLAARQWWSALTPTSGDWVYYNRSVASRNLPCLQADGASVPLSVPINIWSMQCLLTESSVESLPLRATVKLDASGQGPRANVLIENLSQQRVKSGHLLVGLAGPGGRAEKFGWTEFGEIPAGGQVEFERALRVANDRRTVAPGTRLEGPGGGFMVHGGYAVRSLEAEGVYGTSDASFGALGTAPRTAGIEAMLRAGAAVVFAEYDCPTGPFSVRGHKSAHECTELVRLVVAPDVTNAQE
ncbi:MAG TPA: hypothetical protein VMZ50_01280, partial [Phycisphaerae bacterium]|nr:hypothetical protein [Phycisphaerae bacterium]